MSVVVAEDGVGVAVAVLSGASQIVPALLYTGYAVLLVFREADDGDVQESIYMTYLLFQWSRWDYKYLQKALEPDCKVLFSKDYKQRVLRYLSGSIPVVRMSKKDDTIVCWYDVQAVLCWWICHLLRLKKVYHLYQYPAQTEADDEEPRGFVFV